jgi:hypothetical protein
MLTVIDFSPSEGISVEDVSAWMRGERLPKLNGDAQVIEEVITEDTSEFLHTFDRLPHTDPAMTLLVRVDTSLDDGKTWRADGFYATTGGYLPAEDDELASATEQVYTLDGENWLLVEGAVPKGATTVRPRRTLGCFTHSRSEGFYSEDAGVTWNSMIGLAPEKYRELAANPDIQYEKRAVVYLAPYLLRKIVVVGGNAQPVSITLRTTVK